ncbi:1,4-dihydroxy-2-naphthoate prenyltransferase [Lactobacillus sp. XV13L]|nr:1,4-dihydroxy-2-naphthoate prenyltransferase [Lactobacillus sp. XV13L]
MEAQKKYNRLTMTDFLELVRLNAKLASLMPYLFGVLFAYFYFHTFNWQNSLIYLVAQGAIALFVTGFNNVQDYRLAKSKDFQEEHNLIGNRNLSPTLVMNLMLGLLLLASALGIWLTARTDLFILLIGGPGILVTIFYTYGPVPFSRIPIGELLAGLVEGLGVTFLAIYVNVPASQLASLTLSWPSFALSGNLANLLIVFWVALPQIFLNAAIMLADNTSDLQQDLVNGRHTLPSYIGVPTALKLFTFLSLAPYAAVVLGIVFRILPIWQLLVFITLPKVYHNVQKFHKKQTKDMTFWVDKDNIQHREPNTFDLVPQNLLVFQGMQIIGLIIGILLPQVKF